MKKLLSILLVFILCFSLASCGNKDAEFKTAYTGIYAEFALNPSGSLNSYSTEMNEMQQEISKLIKAADIY